MQRLLAGVILGALLTAAPLAMAQDVGLDKTEAFPFQTVRVGPLDYTIDPFYVVGCFWIKHDPGDTLWDGTAVVTEDGLATMQCFHRNEQGKMVPWQEFVASDGGVLEHTDLGQAMYAGPQIAVEP